MTDYLTIPNVEVVTVGMSWPASTGDVTLTLEHLADMVAAADDPLVRPARVKLGHTDPRFNPDLGDHNPYWDGEPVFGSLANLRLINDGAVLMADLINVPEWLAAAAPSSYPSRSAEWNWDIETPGGKHYTAVLTGLALLGDKLPAIMDLEDLEAVLVSGPDGVSASMDPMEVNASADVDKVIDVLIRDWIEDPDHPERYWWWPRAVWTDPNEVIVDDDDGHLWAVPFSSNDQGDVTFDDAREVRQTFVDVASGDTVAAVAAEKRGKPEKVFASRKELAPLAARKRPVSGLPKAAGTVGSMEVTEEIRTKLGLDESATEEDVLAKIDEIQGETETPDPNDPDVGSGGSEEPDPPTPEPRPGNPEAEADGEPAGDGEPEPEASTVTVDRAEWERTKAQAQEGAAARQEQRNERQERILNDAVKAGKFPPSRKDHYRDLLKADPEGTEQLIESLEKGLIPTSERGGDTTADASDKATHDRIMAGFGVKRSGS
jgi:hypothetical protein